MTEIWKPVVGSTKYYVSNYGKVKSLCYRMTQAERELIPYTHKNGYKEISLCEYGKVQRKGLAKLVAECFIDNPNNYRNVIHIDKDLTNNHASNLRWSNEMDNH